MNNINTSFDFEHFKVVNVSNTPPENINDAINKFINHLYFLNCAVFFMCHNEQLKIDYDPNDEDEIQHTYKELYHFLNAAYDSRFSIDIKTLINTIETFILDSDLAKIEIAHSQINRKLDSVLSLYLKVDFTDIDSIKAFIDIVLFNKTLPYKTKQHYNHTFSSYSKEDGVDNEGVDFIGVLEPEMFSSEYFKNGILNYIASTKKQIENVFSVKRLNISNTIETASPEFLPEDTYSDIDLKNIIKKIALMYELGVFEPVLQKCKEGNTDNFTRAGKVINAFTGIGASTLRKCLEAIYLGNDGNKKNHPFTNPANRIFVNDIFEKFKLIK